MDLISFRSITLRRLLKIQVNLLVQEDNRATCSFHERDSSICTPKYFTRRILSKTGRLPGFGKLAWEPTQCEEVCNLSVKSDCGYRILCILKVIYFDLRVLRVKRSDWIQAGTWAKPFSVEFFTSSQVVPLNMRVVISMGKDGTVKRFVVAQFININKEQAGPNHTPLGIYFALLLPSSILVWSLIFTDLFPLVRKIRKSFRWTPRISMHSNFWIRMGVETVLKAFVNLKAFVKLI
jgi:hypothetical protein